MSKPPPSDNRFGSDDRQLAADLNAAAAHVSARPDIGEVEAGAARVRSRRRAATGVAAAAIVAAAGGAGFGLGRAAGGPDTTAMEAPDAPGDNAETATTISTATTTIPTATTSTAAIPIDTIPTATVPAVVPTVAVPVTEPSAAPGDEPVPVTTTVGAGDRSAPVPDMASSYYPGMPAQYDLVSERTDDSGMRVRVLRGPTWDQGYPMEGWTPAEFCWATGDLRVTFDSPSLVDVASFAYFTELFDGVEAQVATAGWADGQVLRLGMVQTDTDATDVVVTWDDGITAAAPVVDGIAVVASPGLDSDPQTVWELSYTVDLIGPTGTTSIGNGELDHFHDPAYRAACEPPPPALPDAGEPPADANAGEALAARFAELWARDVPFAEKPQDLLDDWTGVVAAAEAVNSGSYADAAATAEHVIDEFVFTSPTEAWLRYTITTDMGTFGQRYATATLVDGLWQFPRAAVCQDFSLAGGGCEPFAEPIYPPSWYAQQGSYCVDPGTAEPVCAAGTPPDM